MRSARIIAHPREAASAAHPPRAPRASIAWMAPACVTRSPAPRAAVTEMNAEPLNLVTAGRQVDCVPAAMKPPLTTAGLMVRVDVAITRRAIPGHAAPPVHAVALLIPVRTAAARLACVSRRRLSTVAREARLVCPVVPMLTTVVALEPADAEAKARVERGWFAWMDVVNHLRRPPPHMTRRLPHRDHREMPRRPRRLHLRQAQRLLLCLPDRERLAMFHHPHRRCPHPMRQHPPPPCHLPLQAHGPVPAPAISRRSLTGSP